MSSVCDRPEHSEQEIFAGVATVRVVLDTNLMVSELISGPAHRADSQCRSSGVGGAVMSDATFAELEEVLHQPASPRNLFHARFAAFCKSSSSVASGRPVRKASSRYEASYAESWYRLAS